MFGKKEIKRDLEAYSLFDSKAAQYNEPSYYKTEAEAIRTTERTLLDPRFRDSILVTNSTDFSLFHIGYYDRATGTLEPITPPRHILNLHELKAQLEITQEQIHKLPPNLFEAKP